MSIRTVGVAQLRLVAGDHAAFTEIYDRYAVRVFAVAHRLLRNSAMAEEVTQEVFTFLWDQPHRFDSSRGSLGGWLTVLARRRSIDRVRQEEGRQRSEVRCDLVVPVAVVETEVVDRFAVAWTASQVRDALGQLPPLQREAIVLAYYGGRTYRQVAEDLGLPEGTVKSRLRMAMITLNEVLRPILSDESVG